MLLDNRLDDVQANAITLSLRREVQVKDPIQILGWYTTSCIGNLNENMTIQYF